jgi:hypothetical protein
MRSKELDFRRAAAKYRSLANLASGGLMAELGDGSRTSERLHALNAVRGVALLLGIVFHATLSFLPGGSNTPISRLGPS